MKRNNHINPIHDQKKCNIKLNVVILMGVSTVRSGSHDIKLGINNNHHHTHLMKDQLGRSHKVHTDLATRLIPNEDIGVHPGDKSNHLVVLLA